MKKNKFDNVCFIVLGLLGDVLMRTPLISEFKKAYKNSKVTVIVDPIGEIVFKNNKDVDEIIVINRNRTNIYSYYWYKIKTQLNIFASNFDLIVDLYGGSSSNTMMRLSQVKCQLGFFKGKIYSKNLKKLEQQSVFSNPYHITNRLFELFDYLQIKLNNVNTKPILNISQKTHENIKNYMSTFKYQNYYLLSLGSGGLEKLLDMHKVYEMIGFLYCKYNLVPSIILNPGQEFLKDELITRYLIPNEIQYNDLELLTIEEIASLIKQSNFIIVPDTGLYHIAVSVETPLFTVFTYTNPILVEPKNMIYEYLFEPKEPNEYDKFGLTIGTKSIDSSKIFKKIDSFMNKLKVIK